LGEPRRAGVAVVEYARHRFLCRGARESARPVRPARDFQCRPGPALAKAGGRSMENIFVQRLWRSLKYQEVYLNAYATIAEVKAGIGTRSASTMKKRQHQSLGNRTLLQIYQEHLQICGRLASPTAR